MSSPNNLSTGAVRPWRCGWSGGPYRQGPPPPRSRSACTATFLTPPSASLHL